MRVSASFQIIPCPMGRLRLGSGPHVVGRLGSGMQVSASFQIIPRPVDRLGLGSWPHGLVPVFSCGRSLYVDWRMVAVVGGNALHYVKRDGKMSGRGMSWGNMSEGGNVQGESPTLGQLCRSTGHTPVPSSCLRRDKPCTWGRRSLSCRVDNQTINWLHLYRNRMGLTPIDVTIWRLDRKCTLVPRIWCEYDNLKSYVNNCFTWFDAVWFLPRDMYA